MSSQHPRAFPPAHRWLVALVVVMSMPLLAACGSGSGNGGASSPAPAASSAQIPQLTWSMPYPIDSLDSAKAFNTSSLLGMSIGLETLETFDKHGRLLPLLATSVRQPNPTTYVYALRQGVKFWDGNPMTAQDVAYSLNRQRDPQVASQMATFFENVASIDATGQLEVTVKLKSPDATWKYVPALAGQVVEKAYAERAGKGLGGAKWMTMGTGPYRFTSFTPEQQLVAKRFAGYWGPAPSAQQVTIRTITDDATRLLAMRTGDIDGSFYVPATGIDDWKRLNDARVEATGGTDSYMFFFNTQVKPFDDVHVRRAFAYALDRQAIARDLLKGQAQAADLYIPKGVWTNLLPAAQVNQLYAGLPTYPFDLRAAKAELAKSSVPKGFSVTLQVPSGTDALSKSALTLAANLKQIGVNLTVKEVPAAQWTARVYGHQGLSFEALGDASVFPDPNYYASYLDATQAKPNGTDYASFNDPEATRLFQQQKRETDPAKRVASLRRLATIAADQLPYLGIFWQDTNAAVSDKLVYDDLGPWFYLTNWAAAIKAAR